MKKFILSALLFIVSCMIPLSALASAQVANVQQPNPDFIFENRTKTLFEDKFGKITFIGDEFKSARTYFAISVTGDLRKVQWKFKTKGISTNGNGYDFENMSVERYSNQTVYLFRSKEGANVGKLAGVEYEIEQFRGNVVAKDIYIFDGTKGKVRFDLPAYIFETSTNIPIVTKDLTYTVNKITYKNNRVILDGFVKANKSGKFSLPIIGFFPSKGEVAQASSHEQYYAGINKAHTVELFLDSPAQLNDTTAQEGYFTLRTEDKIYNIDFNTGKLISLQRTSAAPYLAYAQYGQIVFEYTYRGKDIQGNQYFETLTVNATNGLDKKESPPVFFLNNQFTKFTANLFVETKDPNKVKELDGQFALYGSNNLQGGQDILLKSLKVTPDFKTQYIDVNVKDYKYLIVKAVDPKLRNGWTDTKFTFGNPTLFK